MPTALTTLIIMDRAMELITQRTGATGASSGYLFCSIGMQGPNGTDPIEEGPKWDGPNRAVNILYVQYT